MHRETSNKQLNPLTVAARASYRDVHVSFTVSDRKKMRVIGDRNTWPGSPALRTTPFFRRRPPAAAHRSFMVGSCSLAAFAAVAQGSGPTLQCMRFQSKDRNYLCTSSASYIHQQINFNSKSRYVTDSQLIFVN